MPVLLVRIVMITLQCGFAGIVNVAMTPNHKPTMKEIVSSLIISIFCGWVIYHFSLEWDISEDTRVGIVCTVALCGREILSLIQKFVQKFLCKKFGITTADIPCNTENTLTNNDENQPKENV